MEKKDAIVALTYIISGALMQLLNGVQDGYPATVVTITGFIVFFIGLNKLKQLVDGTGQTATGILMIGAIIGTVAALIDFIPFLGSYAYVVYFLAFLVELIGLIQFKSSRTFGPTGRSGFSVLSIAMVISILRALIGMLPLFDDSLVIFFLGDIIISMFTVLALILVLVGWMKVQEDLAERFVAEPGA